MNWLQKLAYVGALSNTEWLREPVRQYIEQKFSEYSPNQLLMFGLTHDELIEPILKKILSIDVKIYPSQGGFPGPKPSGAFRADEWDIILEGIDQRKYDRGGRYADYVDSVLYHELVHAVNYVMGLFKEVTYDAMTLGDDYYGDPEEQRAYKAQMRIFLMNTVGLSEAQARRLMNEYSSDFSETRRNWVSAL